MIRRLLLLFLVLVLGGLVVVDVVARRAAEGHLRQIVVDRVQPGGEVSVRISSFPFLGRLLVSGTVSRVDAEVRDLTVGGMTFRRAGVRLHDVRIDRDALVEEQRGALESIGRGTALAELSEDELSRLVGTRVDLEDGRARVDLGGGLVGVEARLEGRTLVVDAAGLTLPAVEIPELPLVDCLTSTEFLRDRLRLTCSIEDVPVELARRGLESGAAASRS